MHLLLACVNYNIHLSSKTVHPFFPLTYPVQFAKFGIYLQQVAELALYSLVTNDGSPLNSHGKDPLEITDVTVAPATNL